MPGLDQRVQVSVGGGDRPVWRASGREIVYRTADGWVSSVRFSARADGPNVGRPVPLFPDSFGAATGRTSHVDYDVHPDGVRFVMVGGQAGGMSIDLGVVLGWFGELRRLAPPGR
jgi:hypothetical protein